MIGIKLKKYKKETMNKICEYLNPKYVYFKIDENELLVKKDAKVLKGEKILKTKYDTFIHSSVSGIVIDTLVRIATRGVESNFVFTVRKFAASALLIDRAENVEKLTDAFNFGIA